MKRQRSIQPRRRGRPDAYAWDRWADGKAHTVRRGKHFECQVDSFLSVLRKRAALLGKTIDIEFHGDVVRFQFGRKAS